jgi:multiple sugar transport system ATP-binding protein
MIEPMGAETLVWTSIAGQPFAIRLEGDSQVKVGDQLAVDFPPQRLNLFDLETGVRL